MRVLILLALVSVSSALRYISEKYDAVVILPDSEAPTIEYLPDGTTLPPFSSSGDCKTLSGANGRCIPYDTCYPYGNFFLGEIRSVGEEFNTLEIVDIINSTDSCTPSGDLPLRSDAINYICCPTPEAGLKVRDPANEPEEDIVNAKIQCGGSYEAPEGEKRVVGGRPANPGEFPWAVALLNKGSQFCGGSLISANYVLTAAHCVQGMTDIRGMQVKIGSYDWAKQEPNSETRSAIKVLYHRGFSMQTLQDDVALIKLSSPVGLAGANIQAVCLNEEEVPYTKKADLAGWGKTGNSNAPSRTLRTVNMRVNTREECRKAYEGTNAPPLTSGMICAGEKSPALKDACNGDSGGPFTYNGSGKAKQIGIVSWGIGCGQKYGVYTNVQQYLPWINRNSGTL